MFQRLKVMARRITRKRKVPSKPEKRKRPLDWAAIARAERIDKFKAKVMRRRKEHIALTKQFFLSPSPSMREAGLRALPNLGKFSEAEEKRSRRIKSIKGITKAEKGRVSRIQKLTAEEKKDLINFIKLKFLSPKNKYLRQLGRKALKALEKA